MSTQTISLFVVGLFFLVNLIIGLRASKSVKTIEDYAVGNKNWSTSALVMSSLATGLSGAMLLRGTNNLANIGICVLVGPVAGFLSLPFRYIFLSRNTNLIKKSISIGDVVRNLYGPKAQIFSGLLTGIFSIIYVGMEIQVLGTILNHFFGISKNFSIGISAFIVSLYTALGGIKAVIKTDIMQFIILVIAIFLLSGIVVSQIGNIPSLFEQVPSKLLTIYGENNKAMSYFFSLFLLDSIFSGWTLMPHNFQRFLMTKNSFQVKKMFLLNHLGWLVFAFSLLVIAFTSVILFPDFNGSVFFNIMDTSIPDYYKGMIIVGVIAFVFSTSDSCLHNASMSFYYDFYSKIRNEKIKDLKNIRILTFSLGIIATVFSIYGFALMRVDYTAASVATTLFFPITIGLLGLKTKSNEFWISAILGILSFILLKLGTFGSCLSEYSTMIGTLINAITFLIIHIYNNKGFAWDKKMHNDSFSFFKSRGENIIKKIFSKKSIINIHDRIGNLYVYFGLLYIAVILSSYFLWGNFSLEVESPALLIKMIALIMCCLLSTYRIWPRILRIKFGESFWYLSLIYCLPFLATMMLILSRGATEYVIHMSISLMFLLILVSWRMAVQIILIGVVSAIAVCYGLLQIDFSEKIFSKEVIYYLLYQSIFGGLIALFFSKRKSFSIDLVNFNNNFLTNVNIEAGKEILNIKKSEDNFYNLLARGEISLIKKLEEVEKLLTVKDIDNSKKYLEDIKSYIKYSAKRSSDYFRLFPEEIDIQEIAFKIENLFMGGGIKEISVSILTNHKHIVCDYMEFFRIITHLFNKFQEKVLQIKANNESYITIYITDTNLHYDRENFENKKTVQSIMFTITSADYVDKDILDFEHTVKIIKPKNILPISIRDLSQIGMERSLDAQYGNISDLSTEDEVILSLTLPVDIYEVRSKSLDLEDNDMRN